MSNATLVVYRDVQLPQSPLVVPLGVEPSLIAYEATFLADRRRNHVGWFIAMQGDSIKLLHPHMLHSISGCYCSS